VDDMNAQLLAVLARKRQLSDRLSIREKLVS
jgi:hypothetical protein